MDSYFATERHLQIRDQARTFAEADIRPRTSAMEASRSVDHDLSRLIARQGWIASPSAKNLAAWVSGTWPRPSSSRKSRASAVPWERWCRPRS